MSATTTFPVDDVLPAAMPLPTLPWAERVAAQAQTALLACAGDGSRPSVDTRGVHPLLMAVHLAFSEHRPLVLTPEALWLTIGQGVALHVQGHAEALRERLVRHRQGRRTIRVELGALPEDVASWMELVDRLRDGVIAEVGPGWGRWFACDYSTSTALDRSAAAVVMLDAFSKYFSYLAVGICGIPKITITGTTADWETMCERVALLPELGLERWASSLDPILAQFVAATQGRVDTRFWQEIYKPRSAYGADQIAGWIGRLYPYVGANGVYDQPNPMLEVSHEDMLARTNEPHVGIGSITTDSVPSNPSRISVRVADVTGHTRLVWIEGGLCGVSQDEEGRLCPFSGFAVLAGDPGDACAWDRMNDVIDRIIADHPHEPVRETNTQRSMSPLAQLHSRIDSARLVFGSAVWTIRSSARIQQILLEDRERGVTGYYSLLIDLPDGRGIACSHRGWFVLPAAYCMPDEASARAIRKYEQMLDDGVLLPDELDAQLGNVQIRHQGSLEGLSFVGALHEILERILDSEGRCFGP
ncbi:DUF4419 domain-containing protein [Paraliomyxa miuraensis]|uniref:DUF4419 domain-containing protein n=1 Tax=Paraliomyxa miuraensis TaxID=376150 RepID=UPI002250B6A4|nr:DUF4419 domain-containing protein [Paraliomyxa miuraensis]MCX4247105.1 DUF4419 domain-containing protein [Paraliomyxa miuraensis]